MAVTIIAFFGLLIRLVSINQSLWLDEGTTALVARDLSWADFFIKFLPADFHPPLYYIVVKIFTSLFNNYSELFLRLPSIIVAVLSIFVVYKIGSALFEERTGRVAALLIATSPLHVYYSQEARMYSMGAFFVALAIYFYIVFHKQHKNLYLLLMSLSLACAFWTDYLTLFILPVFVIHALLEEKKLLKPVIGALFLVALLCSPMLLFLPNQFSGGLSVSGSNWWEILGKTNLQNILLIPVKFILGRISFSQPSYFIIVSFFILIFSYLILKAKKHKNSDLLFLWLMVPVAITILVGLFIPILSYFRLLFLLPSMYLLVSVGLIKLKIGPIILLFLLIANLYFCFIYFRTERFQKENWRGLVKLIENSSTNNSQVIFPAKSQMEAYKYYAKKSNYGDISILKQNTSNVWLIRYIYDIVDPTDSTRLKLEGLGYERISEYDLNGVLVYLYASRN